MSEQECGHEPSSFEGWPTKLCKWCNHVYTPGGETLYTEGQWRALKRDLEIARDTWHVLEAELQQAREEHDRLLRTVSNTPLVPKDDYVALDAAAEGLAALLRRERDWGDSARHGEGRFRPTYDEIDAALAAWQEHKARA